MVNYNRNCLYLSGSGTYVMPRDVVVVGLVLMAEEKRLFASKRRWGDDWRGNYMVHQGIPTGSA